MQKDYGKKIGQATKWSSITEVFVKLVSPFVNMVLARLLAPEAFGMVATITMVISFTEIFTDAGFQKYIIQHEFKDKEELDKNTNVAFWTNFAISCLVCLIIYIFRHKLAVFVGSPGLGNSISIASVSIILVAFSSIQMARYKRDFDFKTLFFVRMGTALIPLVVTIPLAMILRNYWALLIGSMSINLFNAVVLTLKSKWKPKFYYNFGILKQMLSFSVWTLFESIAIWLTTHIDIFIVGSFLNEHFLGLYKTSMTTINAYMSIITSAVIPVLFSALSRYQNDDEKFKSTYFTFQRFTAILIIPMGFGMYLFSDTVTTILLGSQWLEASGFIGLWGLMSALAVIYSNFPSEVYRSKGQPKISLIAQLIYMCVMIPVLAYFVGYGFKALYISRSLTRIVMILIAMIVMNFMYKIKATDIIKNTLPMIISSLIMSVAGYLLRLVSNNIVWQLFAVFLCVIVYFGALFLLFPKVRKEIFETPQAKKVLARFIK